MADQVLMNAKKREATGSKAVRKLREQGVMPGVIYGEGKDPIHIQINPKDLDGILHAGQRIISLDVDGKRMTTIIKEVQYDYLGTNLLHADFERISAGHEITVAVPLVLHGTPAGEKEGGWTDFTFRELHVKCIPSKLPAEILVEISQLNLSEGVYVRDLEMPEGVTATDDQDTCIVMVHPPRGEEEEEAEEAEEAEEGLAEPEVVGRKSDEDKQEE